jgi:hypothetical protein
VPGTFVYTPVSDTPLSCYTTGWVRRDAT